MDAHDNVSTGGRSACPRRCLESLGLHEGAISNSLIYPGRMPQESGLLVSNCFLPLHDDGSNQVGRWLVESAGWTPIEDAWDGAKLAPLDDVLRHLDLFVLWLCDGQLRALDLTEPNYRGGGPERNPWNPRQIVRTSANSPRPEGEALTGSPSGSVSLFDPYCGP